ncbi:hypothetical protein BKA69DRAFT_820454 [Paraphysoderma sedebokerense]|nr:hypothetical protein BKA69DRAFT_820454 [Paraphysoderma sedebokerense]
MAVVGVLVASILLYVLARTSTGPGFGIATITLNFFQIVALLRLVDLKWPTELQTVWQMVSLAILNIEFFALECFFVDGKINFSSKLKFALLLPIVLLALVIVLKFLNSLAQYVTKRLTHYRATRRNGKKGNLKRPQWKFRLSKNAILDVFKTFNVLMPLIYMTVTSYSLALFDCTKESDGVYYLDADTSLTCFDEWWIADLGIGVAAVIVYVIGIPLYSCIIFLLIHQKRWQGVSKRNISILLSFKFYRNCLSLLAACSLQDTSRYN